MKFILGPNILDTIEPRLAQIAPDIEIVHLDDKGNPDGDIADAEALLPGWTSPETLARVLEAAPKVRWLHVSSAGVDRLLTPQIVERDLTITNSSGAHAVPIAEFVMMFVLSHAKRSADLLALSGRHEWKRGDDLRLSELAGQTLLIVGLGNIGQEIAKRASAFGMRVFGSRRRPAPMDGVERVVGEDGWRDLLPDADYVVVAAPLTEATRGMIDQEAFARVKQGAYLINIARGQIVDTDALLEALREGKLAGAGLDALPEEPLPPEHPLWSVPNVWITPHISWSSPRVRERTADIFLENARRFVAGDELRNIVDKHAGY